MITRENAAVLKAHPDLLKFYRNAQARERSAIKRLATLPAKGGSKKVQLDRWTARTDLRMARSHQRTAIGAARLRAGIDPWPGTTGPNPR